MVACATGASVAAIQLLVSQPVIGPSSGFMQQNSCAIVDQLKQRLQLVIENGDENGAIEVLSTLEGLTLSKEVLEVTRVGLTVNEFRRRTAQTLPNISRKCRSLIKAWQKLADFQRPQSSCGDSSNGGTPSLVSPASRRGLTPRTPGGGKRVTSTDGKSATTVTKNGSSPSTIGSYAPRLDADTVGVVGTTNSGIGAPVVHKSASVGGALCSAATSTSPAVVVNAASRSAWKHISPDMLPAGVDATSFNAKRKAKGALEGETKMKASKSAKDLDNHDAQQDSGNGCAAHSSTNTTGNGGGLPPTTIATAPNNSGGVSVARKDVQSTAELVAQLTGNLPQNMAASLQSNQPDQKQQPQTTTTLKKISSTLALNENGSGIRLILTRSTSPNDNDSTSSGSTLGKAKRKYTKRAAKFFRASDGMTTELGTEVTNGLEPIVEEATNAFAASSIDDDDNEKKETDVPANNAATTDYWMSMVPTLSALQNLKSKQSNSQATSSTTADELSMQMQKVGSIPLRAINSTEEEDVYVLTGGSNAGGSVSYSVNNYFYTDEIWSTDSNGELLSVAHAQSVADTSKTIDSRRHIFIDVLLPSGFLMPVQCPASRTLEQLKQDVYIQAKKLPPSARPGDISNHIFATFGLGGSRIELYDSRKSIITLCATCLPVFELIQPKAVLEEKMINQKISIVIGFPLAEIEEQMCEELVDFRLELFSLCQKAVNERGAESTQHYAFYRESLVVPLTVKPTNDNYDLREVNENDIDFAEYPDNPEEIHRRTLDCLQLRIANMIVHIEVWWRASPEPGLEDSAPFTHSVQLKDVFGHTPSFIIAIALEHLRETASVSIGENSADFILQIAGQRVFIDDSERDIFEFQYIRSSLTNYRIPHLLLRRRSEILRQYVRPPPIFEPAYSRQQAHEQHLKNNLTFCEKKYRGFTAASNNTVTKSFWDLDENLRIRLHSISKLAVDGDDRFFVRIGVVVGRHLLDVRQTVLVESTKGRFMEHGLVEFGIYVKDVPDSAHFSFTLMCVRGAARANSASALSRLGDGEPLGWSNCRLFDWRRQLTKGKRSISLWPFPRELQQEIPRAKNLNLYLSGAIHPPNVSDMVAVIELEMDDYREDRIVAYTFPDDAVILRFNDVLQERRAALETEFAAAMNANSEKLAAGADASTQPLTAQRRKLALDTKINELRMETTRKKSTTATSKKKTSEIVSDNSSSESDDEKAEGERPLDVKYHDLPFKGLLTPNCREFRRLHRLHRCLNVASLPFSDQRFLWRMRLKLRNFFPQLIVLLAESAHIWCDRERTCEFYALLRSWPSLRVETAIELLDGRYTDARLRALAVENLDAALNTDDQLRLYLLTLVQAIRYEPHASSPLVRMLMRRALISYRVAHTVFWLLRAELAHLLSDTSTGKLSFLYIRYALMLEAICRGNATYLDSTIKQVEMVSQLTYLSTMIRNMGGNKDVATKKLQQELEARKETLQFMDSPLNPIDRLGEIVIKDCRVLGSAKMPLRLTWRNPEPMASLTTETHQLIFKNGDDMRQDMLTIQVMRIMDFIWKSHNCDYYMTLYDVLPMGRNIGLIQVVQNCRTLFEVQCEAGPMASSLNMDTNMLHKFLYRNYDQSDSYTDRVDRFSASLAGYCIATYVIGIRDRHQDNIMIADDGRIFHIDFGHFLGHTKRKLGINRERTDFILTEHFLSAISHSKDYRTSHEVTGFREECLKGFMIVYDHARFYITLFRMMLCMGLPELSSQENVEFLRDALIYTETDRAKVRDAFQATFEQAIRGDWFVSVNWFFHSVKHM